MNRDDKQRLREGVIEYLALRPGTKFTVTAIARSVKARGLVDFDVSEQDVAEALAVLEGYGFVSSRHPALGSIKEYQATSQGVLFHERGE